LLLLLLSSTDADPLPAQPARAAVCVIPHPRFPAIPGATDLPGSAAVPAGGTHKEGWPAQHNC
jgi:hypothetical protein